MASLNLEPAHSALLVIDVQTGLIPFIHESEGTIDRIHFLIRMARLLHVPVFATEQNPERMGQTLGFLRAELDLAGIFSKMDFGVHRCARCLEALRSSGRRQIVIVGLETHICVAQSARGLLDLGFEPWVCPDGVSARSLDRHKLGMEQVRDSGVMPAHTEAVAYDWLGTAEHSDFREALAIVKAHPS